MEIKTRSVRTRYNSKDRNKLDLIVEDINGKMYTFTEVAPLEFRPCSIITDGDIDEGKTFKVKFEHRKEEEL